MSSFIVSSGTINAVVHAICKAERADVVIYGDDLGRDALRLNYAAYGCRYADKDIEPHYLFSWSPKQYTLREMHKALSCWLYQCMEGKQFEEQDIFQRGKKAKIYIADCILHEDQEWDKVPWDLESNRYCEKPLPAAVQQ